MTRTLALALLLMSWCLSAPARAQESAAEDEAAANVLVEQAAAAYDQNQLDEALRLLARAYALSPRPSILYNQAQVLRTKDDCAAALDAYRKFLETAAPDDANRERATRRRDEMQTCADQRKPPAVPAAPRLEIKEAALPAQPAGVIVSAPAQPEEHPRGHKRAMRAGAWAAMGVGVLAAGAAAAFAWKAHTIQNDLYADLNADLQLNKPFVWSDHQSKAADGRTYSAAAWVAGGLATLAAGGSAALFILSRGPVESDPQATALAQPHGCLLGFSGTF